MTPEVATWIVGAAAAAVIGILAHAVRMAFVRLRELEAREGRELAEFKLHVTQTYIARDDWVPMTSRIIGMLEEHGKSLSSHGERLARIDERVNGCKDLHDV